MKKSIVLILLLVSTFSFGQNRMSDTELQAHFDAAVAAEYNGGSGVILSTRADQGDLYFLDYFCKGYLAHFLKTGDPLSLKEVAKAYKKMIDDATPSNTHPNNSNQASYNHSDTFLALWDYYPLGNDITRTVGSGGQNTLSDMHGWRNLTKFLWILKKYPSLRLLTYEGGITYQDIYDDFLDFWEDNVYGKFYTRGGNTNKKFAAGVTWIVSHAAQQNYYAYLCTGKQKYLDITDGYYINPSVFNSSTVDKGFLEKLTTNAAVSNAIDYRGFYGQTSGSSDHSHANADVELLALMFQDGKYSNTSLSTAFPDINQDVIDRFIVSFNFIANGYGNNDPKWKINGTGNPPSKAQYNDGWPLLGRFDETLQENLESVNLNNMIYKIGFVGTLMENAGHLDGTLAYSALAGSDTPVTSITWGDDDQTITDSESLDLSVTFGPTNATDQGVTYSSTNLSAVDNTGTVVGTGSGTLTVIADDTSNSADDDMAFTINPTPVTTLNVTPSTLCLSASKTTSQLSVGFGNTNPTDQTGSWSSDTPSVATVNSSGLVTYVGLGTANITFTATDTTNSASDTVVVTGSASCGDSIEALNLIVYQSSNSLDPSVAVDGLDVTTWEDVSGNGRDATVSGDVDLNISLTRQAEFRGGYFDFPDISELEIQGGTDERTIIAREGDVASANSGYLFGKVSTGPFTVEYGLAYANGDVSGLYVGGNLIGFSNVPPGPNRLFIITISTTTATVRCDGVEIGSGSVGTALATGQSLNLGARTDGSYLMDTGSQMDIFAMATGVASVGEITNIENEFIVNVPSPIQLTIKGFSSDGNSGSYIIINGIKIYIGD